MSHFILACGGTGGHLSPGIAIAERLMSRGHSCRLIVSLKEVDSRLCRKYANLDFVRVPGQPLSSHPVRCLRAAAGMGMAFYRTCQMARQPRPAAMLAFGGFTTVPSVLAAEMRRIPFVLHEANRRVGKAIRALRLFATRVYLPPGVQLHGLHPSFIAHPGYPLRREIRRYSRQTARQHLGLNTDGKLLVVIGGSQGASSLNDWVRDNLQALGSSGINVYCVTGLGKGTDGVFEFPSLLGGTTKAWFTPFTDRMAEVLCAADLVLSRAGAGAVAEMTYCRTPSILIPYPYAADGHQVENARFHERQGAGLVVEQKHLASLLSEVRDLIFNDWLLDQFRQNMRQLYRHDPAETIADDLEAIALQTARRPLAGQPLPA